MNSTKKHQQISETKPWFNAKTAKENSSQSLTRDMKKIVSSSMAIKLVANHHQSKVNILRVAMDMT